MSMDGFIDGFAKPDKRVVQFKSSTDQNAKNKQQKLVLTGKSNGSAANPARSSRTTDFNVAAANDFQGNQQRNVELRGATLFLFPMGGDSPVAPGTLKGASGGNAYELELTGNHNLEFDWTEFDSMSGSKRGNIRNTRLLFMTVIVKHKGFTLTLPNNIWWNEGEAPDLGPGPADSAHILNFMVTRKEAPDGTITNTIYGGVWATNARIPA